MKSEIIKSARTFLGTVYKGIQTLVILVLVCGAIDKVLGSFNLEIEAVNALHRHLAQSFAKPFIHVIHLQTESIFL